MTDLTKATPRPWVQFLDRETKMVEFFPAGRPGSIGVVVLVDTEEKDANAALVCRAVNERDELLSVLRGCVDAFEAIGNKPVAYDRARSMLAIAEAGR